MTVAQPVERPAKRCRRRRIVGWRISVGMVVAPDVKLGFIDGCVNGAELQGRRWFGGRWWCSVPLRRPKEMDGRSEEGGGRCQWLKLYRGGGGGVASPMVIFFVF
jgi:hypothetical protein